MGPGNTWNSAVNLRVWLGHQPTQMHNMKVFMNNAASQDKCMNTSTYMSIHVYASSSFHQDAAQNTPMSAMQKSKGSPSTKGATRIGATPILGTWFFSRGGAARFFLIPNVASLMIGAWCVLTPRYINKITRFLMLLPWFWYEFEYSHSFF